MTYIATYLNDLTGTELTEVRDAVENLIGLSDEGLPFTVPEAFGAVGDGVTDDSQAFIDMSAAFAAAGYGAVKMRTGATYLVGRQIEGGGGARYQGVDILSANGLSYFIVDMNGATLKMKGGLRFGGFDASNVPTVSITNVNIAQRADQGILIRAQNCGAVVVMNGVVDGNCANGIVGGPWGDAGRQCIAYGVHIFECDQVLIDGVVAEDWLLDGFALGYTGLTEASPIAPTALRNCISRRAGRNCISIVGGNGVQLDNCVFEDSGNAVNTVFGRVSTSPASACDWEAESSVIRNGVANHCTFYSGAYGSTALVAGSGDTRGLTFNDCTIDGNIFMQKPEVVFNGGVINGQFGALFGGQARQSDNTVVRNMRGSDVARSGLAVAGTQFITGSDGSGPGVIIEGCNFTLSVTKLNIRGFIVSDTQVTFTCGTDTFANQDYVVLAENAVMRNVTFVDSAGSTASDPPTVNEGYYIITTAGTVAYNCLVVPSANYTLKWNSSLAGGGGTPVPPRLDGRFDNGLDRFQGIMLQREANFGGGYNEWATIEALSAAPAVGTRKNGSLVINCDPAVGETPAWLLAAGTFQPIGIVGSSQGAAQADSAAATVGALVTDFNALLAKLRASKLIAP